MKGSKVTIVTVCYNCIDTIERTIQSVLVQDYENIEYIVIDGGSNDGTAEVIKKYADRLYYWVSEPDRGIYDAMNKGIAKASGEWIHFRNSGDFFLSKHTVSEVFKNDYPEEIAVIHGDCYYVYPEYYILGKPAMLSVPYNQDMPVLHPATFVRTKYQKDMPFDLSYRSAADYNFFYGLCERDYKFFYIPMVIATFATGGFSSNWERAFWEDRRIQGKTNCLINKVKVYYEFVRRKLWWRFKSEKVLIESPKEVIWGQVEYDY